MAEFDQLREAENGCIGPEAFDVLAREKLVACSDESDGAGDMAVHQAFLDGTTSLNMSIDFHLGSMGGVSCFGM